MGDDRENRFDDFFRSPAYVGLKNHLYNYRLRRRAVHRQLRGIQPRRLLEIGCGISPVTRPAEGTVFSDLSWRALKTLKGGLPDGCFVAADGGRLPFRAGAFSHAVCSEVLEHLPDDGAALAETGRVLGDGGALILTFPHRQAYYSVDDRYVGHFRRYEIRQMAERLTAAGLAPRHVEAVLGPLEKLTMMLTAGFLAACAGRNGRREARRDSGGGSSRLLPVFMWLNRIYTVLARADARLSPIGWASVLLIRAEKERAETPAEPVPATVRQGDVI